MTRPCWLAAAALLLGCATGARPPGSPWSFPDEGFAPDEEYVTISGTGKASGAILSETQGKALSRDAALIDAWDRAEAYLEALPLRFGGTVRDRLATSGELGSRLRILVHSAEVVSTRWSKDGTAAVLIRLPKERVRQALGARALP